MGRINVIRFSREAAAAAERIAAASDARAMQVLAAYVRAARGAPVNRLSLFLPDSVITPPKK